MSSAFCDAYLPPGTAHPQTERATLFSFRLTTMGQVLDVTLYRSSGLADIDKATIDCASHIRMTPATVAGKPAEITWIGSYFWRPNHSGFYLVSPDGTAIIPNCAYPRLAARQGRQGRDLIFYHVATDGSARDAAVLQSSGSDDLDSAALDCVSKWKFFPVQENGQPVLLDKVIEIQWRLR
jgi:TonB family protein